ncbi:MAG: exosortase system-associated protein, TIGR04073 family [Deltaproteobacteria bacterium]|nr:exosortase system-associated protein, TIGR04073 family [Deltaproteobacteria bacterium]MBW2362318.1 exosortase system-associated protein, TIGR04073 family [Deltaproteobacteria bacterium]
MASLRSFRSSRRPRIARCIVLATLLCVGFAAAAPAQEMTATRKFGRGLAGLTLGVLELPGNMAQEWRNDGPLSGLTVGFIMGVAKIPARTLIGAYEIVSAPFPLPAGYEAPLAPEFPWGYFQAEPGQVYGFSDRYLSAEMAALKLIPGAEVRRSGGALLVRFPGGLLFQTGKATLNTEAKRRLASVADTLTQNPENRIQIQGFTDSTGADGLNLRLSASRANSVSDFLIRQGVAAHRIETAGYGATRAIASNDTAEGRAVNRRVEIQIRAGGVAAVR